MDATAPPPDPDDALATALAAVADPWALRVVAVLARGPARFGDVRAALPDATVNVLAARLERLTASGLTTAEPYVEDRRRLRYALTSAGHDLAAALAELREWAARREA